MLLCNLIKADRNYQMSIEMSIGLNYYSRDNDSLIFHGTAIVSAKKRPPFPMVTDFIFLNRVVFPAAEIP